MTFAESEAVKQKICTKFTEKTPMPKCDFNKVAKQLQLGCSLANLLYIFRAPFRKNTSGRLLLLNTCNRNYSAQNIL